MRSASAAPSVNTQSSPGPTATITGKLDWYSLRHVEFAWPVSKSLTQVRFRLSRALLGIVPTGLGKALPIGASSRNHFEVSWLSVEMAGKATANGLNVSWQGSIGACTASGAAIATSEL